MSVKNIFLKNAEKNLSWQIGKLVTAIENIIKIQLFIYM